jgi:DNA-binding transcriptional MerR regulator
MAGVSLPLEIPKGTFFKAAEVCELVKVQPYVLRSWEGEFPELGVTKTAGGPRVYRRADIEQVMRIKHLLLVEGLTLAGARRKLSEESAPPAPIEDVIAPETRERLTAVKRGLRSILDLLSPAGTDDGFSLEAPESSSAPEPSEVPESSSASRARATSARGGKNGSSERIAARKKRSD